MMKLRILKGDSAEQLATLDAGSVQLVVTSPPYDNLRDYGGHQWNFEGTARQIQRVLCDGGVCCWNVGDSVVDGSETLNSLRQALYFVDHVGLRMHDTMIYEKLNFGQPSHNRYHQLFEYVFVLSKGLPRVFNPIKDKKNAWNGTKGTFGKNTMREADGSMGERARNVITEWGMRGNVWRGKTRGQEEICESLPTLAHVKAEAAVAKNDRARIKSAARAALFPARAVKLSRALLAKAEKEGVNYDAEPHYVDLLRQSTHIVAMTDDPEYRRWFEQIETQGKLPDRIRRYREIWGAIIEYDRRDTLPIHERIKATPRIRGVGAAARRAGF